MNPLPKSLRMAWSWQVGRAGFEAPKASDQSCQFSGQRQECFAASERVMSQFQFDGFVWL